MSRLIAAVVVVLCSASTANSQVTGLWARSADMCNQQSRVPGDWITVSEMGIRGYNFRCTFFKKEGDNRSYTVDALCGFTDSDVTFRDVFTISDENNTLIIKSYQVLRKFVRC